MPDTVSIDGTPYVVAHRFSDVRAVVDFGGLFVLADRTGSTWELSGVPARDDEKAVLKALTAPHEGKVEVTSTIPDLPEDGLVPGVTDIDR